jgi:hypothetical protein
MDFTVDASLLSHSFVKVEKKLREAELREGRIAGLQLNCEEVRSFRNKQRKFKGMRMIWNKCSYLGK